MCVKENKCECMYTSVCLWNGFVQLSECVCACTWIVHLSEFVFSCTKVVGKAVCLSKVCCCVYL